MKNYKIVGELKKNKKTGCYVLGKDVQGLLQINKKTGEEKVYVKTKNGWHWDWWSDKEAITMPITKTWLWLDRPDVYEYYVITDIVRDIALEDVKELERLYDDYCRTYMCYSNHTFDLDYFLQNCTYGTYMWQTEAMQERAKNIISEYEAMKNERIAEQEWTDELEAEINAEIKAEEEQIKNEELEYCF